MVKLYKKRGTDRWEQVHPDDLVDELPNPQDDDDDEGSDPDFERKKNEIARAVLDGFENNLNLFAHEMKSVMDAQQDDDEDEVQFECARCRTKIPRHPRDPPTCPNCSNRTALLVRSVYKCADCGAPVDPRLPRCANPRCAGTKAVKVGP